MQALHVQDLDQLPYIYATKREFRQKCSWWEHICNCWLTNPWLKLMQRLKPPTQQIEASILAHTRWFQTDIVQGSAESFTIECMLRA